MFRTVLVHHQEQLYKLYIVFGICRCMPVPYVWPLCGYSHTTARRIAQRRKRLTTHFSERIPIVKRRMTIGKDVTVGGRTLITGTVLVREWRN